MASYDYTWDGHGRLTSAVQMGPMFTDLYGAGGLHLTHTYDTLDRLTETKTQWLDDSTWKELPDRGMKVVYDAAGNRTQVDRYRQVEPTESADQQPYTVNDLNQVTAFTNTSRALFTGSGALAEGHLELVSEGNGTSLST